MKIVGDFIVRRLFEWGIKQAYGYPGGQDKSHNACFEQRKRTIDFIQVRHEEDAAFMACGHAKFTGEPGLCRATSGPGVIHLLNGLYDAKMDHQLVVTIVGRQQECLWVGIIRP